MVCATSTELCNTARKQLGMSAQVPHTSVTEILCKVFFPILFQQVVHKDFYDYCLYG